MFLKILTGLALAAIPGIATAQQPTTDTSRVQRDTLTRQPVTLQAVTITTAPAVRDEPSSAARVTQSVIREVPALNAYDLLRQSAGLEVHDQGQGPGFASDASIRGFSSDHSTDLALWVDGVPINEPVNGHAEGYSDWSLLLPEAVSSIEVLKGPSSALFGNFAMAGVVNVRTLERVQGTSVTASGGSFGRYEGALVTGLDRDATGAVLALRGVHDAGWRPNSGNELGQVHGRWVGTVSPTATLDAGVELYATRWDSPGFLSDSQFRRRDYSAVANRTDGGYKRRAQERISLRVFAGPSLLWRSTAYATQGRWQLYLTTPPEPGAGEGTGSQTEEDDNRFGLGATSALTWALPRGDVTFGVEARWDHSDYQNWFTTDRVRDSAQTVVGAEQASGAAFVQASLDLGPHVRTTVGGRYEALDTRSEPRGLSESAGAKGVFAPKVGVLFHIPSVGAVYGNVSRGYRQTDGVITDPSLPFITEWAYEAGAKLDLRGLTASAALFRMDVSNEQTFDPVTLRSTSGGASRRQGLELELEARPGAWLTLSTDWTLNDARYLHLVTDRDTLDGARVFNTARYVGAAAAGLAPPGRRWQARLSANVLGPYSPFDAPGVVLPAFAVFHASAGVRIERVGMVELGIRNLFNRAYPELRAGSFVAPGQPRSVFVSLRTAS